MNRIRKGDEVVVIAGRDKGRRGRVLRVSPADGKVLVENINIVKKTVRPNPNTGEAGGIVEQERLLDASNVMLFNPETGKGGRVGFKTGGDGRKTRYFRSGGKEVA